MIVGDHDRLAMQKVKNGKNTRRFVRDMKNLALESTQPVSSGRTGESLVDRALSLYKPSSSPVGLTLWYVIARVLLIHPR